MRGGDIVARLLFGYWLVIAIINLCCVRGFGADGVAESLVFAVIGIACWVVTRFVTQKLEWLAVKSRRMSRRGERLDRWR